MPSPRTRALSRLGRLTAALLFATGLVAVAQAPATAGVTKAVSTSTNVAAGTGACVHGPGEVNCNLYAAKEDVWLSGLPDDLSDGEYFIAVLNPGGQNDPNDGSDDLLSTDTQLDRTFTLSGGVITASGGHTVANDKLQLVPYSDTQNPGGVYILAVCAYTGQPVAPSSCKYDAFKVDDSPTTDPGDEFALPLMVSKDADGAYTRTYTWDIAKAVDKTVVNQVGGNATFNYTVDVTRDAGADSLVGVTGTITVSNPNAAAVDGVDVTDQLSDGTVCDVTGGSDATIAGGSDATFAYSCDLAALPQGQLDNTAAIAWDEQVLTRRPDPRGRRRHLPLRRHPVRPVRRRRLRRRHRHLRRVRDPGHLRRPRHDLRRRVVHLLAVIAVPSGCKTYDNTAEFTTDDTAATGSDDASVTVCGPLATGARTIGFWQNKNGQSVILAGPSTGTPEGVQLRHLPAAFKPFQDLSATATCKEVATYAMKVIKEANASGASMNKMLKAQMLATALDVYFTGPGNAGQSFLPHSNLGSTVIDLTKICSSVGSCPASFTDVSSAFGGATSLTVSQMLAYAATQSNVGGSVWYGQVKATQEKAKNAFDAINNEVAFGL